MNAGTVDCDNLLLKMFDDILDTNQVQPTHEKNNSSDASCFVDTLIQPNHYKVRW
jgi:hypothetical protein